MNYVKLKRDIQKVDNADEAISTLLEIAEALLEKVQELESRTNDTAQYLDETIDKIKNGNKL